VTSRATLREQAERIANTLKADLVQFLQQVPAAEVVRTYSSSRVIARIAVAGYGEKGPESAVVALGVATDRPTNRWEVQVSTLSRLTFSECGVRFHGQESVVVALRTDKGVRIPPAELQKPDVARLSALLNGNCASASTGTASAMFVQAVRLTMTLGSGFGIQKDRWDFPSTWSSSARRGDRRAAYRVVLAASHGCLRRGTRRLVVGMGVAEDAAADARRRPRALHT
jgi:hypothetical protein